MNRSRVELTENMLILDQIYSTLLLSPPQELSNKIVNLKPS